MDPLFLEERADRLLESLFAHAEDFTDFLRQAVIVVRQLSTSDSEDFDDLFRHRTDAPVPGLAESEIEFPVGTDRADIAGDHIANLQGSDDIRMVDEPPMRIVHNQVEAQRAGARGRRSLTFKLSRRATGEIPFSVSDRPRDLMGGKQLREIGLVHFRWQSEPHGGFGRIGCQETRLDGEGQRGAVAGAHDARGCCPSLRFE